MDLRLRVEAVLFDKDGTLFDFDATWTVWAGRMLDRLSGGDADLARRMAGAVGYDMKRARFLPGSMVIAGTPDDVVGALAPILGRNGPDLLDELNASAAEAPMAEAVPLAPLLARLRGAGLKLGVATNDAEAPAHAHLGAVGVETGFDFIAGSDSGWTPKPDGAMCRAFAMHVGIAPERIVMVGDSLHDVHAGRAAGMQTLAVTDGPNCSEALIADADGVIPNIGALEQWIGLV